MSIVLNSNGFRPPRLAGQRDGGRETPRDAPRCPVCDYLLYGLFEDRCPECGVPFDPDLVRLAHAVLPWEHVEAAGPIRRVVKTLPCIWAMPFRRFRPLRLRADVPIRNARSLVGMLLVVAALVGASRHPIPLTVDALLAGPLWGWTLEPVEKTVERTVKSWFRITFVAEWQAKLRWFIFAYVEQLAAVAAAAGAVALLYRRRGGVASFTSLMALLLAAVLLVDAVDIAASIVIPRINKGYTAWPQLLATLYVYPFLRDAAVPVFAWLLVRNTFGGPRWRNVGAVVVCGLAAMAAGHLTARTIAACAGWLGVWP